MRADLSDAKPTNSDPDVTITLPLSWWRVVMRCLGWGSFTDVAQIVYRIGEQAFTLK